MEYRQQRALELLRLGVGNIRARFREHQEEAIRRVIRNDERLLIVQKTGWGKSYVYFILTKLLREQGEGPVLLISPLISLMWDQIKAAERMGLSAKTINSTNPDDWQRIIESIRNDETDILLISPERLANENFMQQVLDYLKGRVSMLVVDEAHCISDWGHDFRPDYRRIERIAQGLPSNVRVLLTTATANNRVVEDLLDSLGPNIGFLGGDLSRNSITLQTLRLDHQAERLAWIAQALEGIDGSGIVYALTKRDVHIVSNWLKNAGFEVEPYTGDSGDQRQDLQNRLFKNEIKALVATTALGMGYDKPDISFVIHYQSPNSVVDYYQQVGRAGRDSDAYGILLSGSEEIEIAEYFRDSAFPTRDEATSILQALENSQDGLSIYQILAEVNIKLGRVNNALKILSLESPAPVAKDGPKWRRVAVPLEEQFWERVSRITAIRKSELEEMQRYIDLKSGHMEFLINRLNGDVSQVKNPPLPPLGIQLNGDLVKGAIGFLNRTENPISPRKQWPNSFPDPQFKGRILPEHQFAEGGSALCYWGDPGWGKLVQKGKYETGLFDQELIVESVKLIDRYPEPLKWVCWIPSSRDQNLVADLAGRLARELGIEVKAALRAKQLRPQQKTRENSLHQVKNLIDAFEITPGLAIPEGRVLLVDDIVDSGWTFTVAAKLLRQAGSGSVYPFALARAAGV